MKFATINDGTKDGQLHIVSRDLTNSMASQVCRTLQMALDNWEELEPLLQAEYDQVNRGAGGLFDANKALSPLPRAWQFLDGSVFESHGDLMQKVFKLDPIDRKGLPLMYQGLSDHFLAPTQDVKFPSEDDFIDFEGEFGVITDDVPMGISPDEAGIHIRLLVQINDWSLRAIAPFEMKTGFGWLRAKPASSMAPIAITPDELNQYWRDSRVDLPLNVHWNGERFGAAQGYHMSAGFNELIAHAAYSRDLSAGTVIGSGTVSNENYREVGSSCIAEKRGIEMLDNVKPQTEYMRFGDSVRMEANFPDGLSLFGAIEQKVVQK